MVCKYCGHNNFNSMLEDIRAFEKYHQREPLDISYINTYQDRWDYLYYLKYGIDY